MSFTNKTIENLEFPGGAVFRTQSFHKDLTSYTAWLGKKKKRDNKYLRGLKRQIPREV